MKLTIRRPDDWHVHFRDGAMMEAVVPETARDCGRAIVMPNLVPPVVTSADAAAYRERIMACVPAGSNFEPLMTLYLTEGTDPDDVARAYRDGLVTAVKLYPAGATTNSDSGVRDIDRAMPALERMAEIGMVLCVHGEVTSAEIDIFDREAIFIERVLEPLRERLPELRVVMEHVTTKDAVDYVRGGGERLGATITTHHLMIDRNHMLVGGIRPHYYCLPVAKRREHREALVAAATSGEGRFFHGTDTAPHPVGAKEAECGCAGVFSAPNALACLAQVFDDAGALDRLEAFASLNGPAFYGLAPNEERVTLVRGEARTFARDLETGAGPVRIFEPPVPVRWSVG